MPRLSLALAAAPLAFLVPAAHAAPLFNPGDLVVSYSVYEGTASTVTVGQTLPGGGTAVANGTYPGVFANAGPDAAFGVTSPILLQDVSAPNLITASSTPTLNVTQATGIVTSFSSKSELGLNLSTDGTSITLMGYAAPVNALDVSNTNTPGIIEPGNPVTATPTARAVVQIGPQGNTLVTPTNAYAGNNGRNAILANGSYYLVGNAGNGNGSPQVTAATGVQRATPGVGTTASPQNTTQVGSFNITQLGYAADKAAKDNNYRGETIFNNTLFVTKGSGSNGIDTVYQVGATGSLPTSPSATITPLPGFPTQLAKSQTCTVAGCNAYFVPFGLFFANANTLYVADEGPQQKGSPIADPNAGLQKWSLVNGTWQLDYVLQNGLALDQSYTVAGLDPSLDPYNTGLRNLTGRVNADGTVTLYAETATYSLSGDAGADPNEIVAITDSLGATSLPGGESFNVIEGPQFGVVYRGVAFAPVPEPATIALLGIGVAGLLAARRRSGT